MTEMPSKIKELVEKMIELHRDLRTSNIPEEKNKLKQQIAALDKQIASHVNNLYNLNKDEIKAVKKLAK